VCFVVGDKKEEVASRGHEFWKLPVITAGVTFLWIAPTKQDYCSRMACIKGWISSPRVGIESWQPRLRDLEYDDGDIFLRRAPKHDFSLSQKSENSLKKPMMPVLEVSCHGVAFYLF